MAAFKYRFLQHISPPNFAKASLAGITPDDEFKSLSPVIKMPMPTTVAQKDGVCACDVLHLNSEAVRYRTLNPYPMVTSGPIQSGITGKQTLTSLANGPSSRR
ncbi:hypothetical protein [Caenibius tardaugens]|uniref:hypothetical protein n=1 Tax=Caenibius tardaugens TaxID=169176 RepID=UPI000F5F1001|nr:hypothetical protein [Caenibius tardaugens]AZI34840.1 hypothetical protein EGO55_01800 [Caenibius tardaugens NBRC 16725]